MRYRVEQLAAACQVSVDTVRYYQSRGLLPPPAREGRLAWYGPEHAQRIEEIRSLQRKGLTLAAIRRVVSGELGAADADLAAAVAAARDETGARAAAGDGRALDADGAEGLTLDEFSARSGVPASLIQAVEREGIRLGHRDGGDDRYTSADIELVRTALRLLEFGLPLPDLLALARDADAAMRGLAERAVELFDEHVRKPIRDTAGDDDHAAEQMVAAFRELLPAVTALVSHHFRTVLLETAAEHIEEPS
ncbi:MAG: MerR family transcriptional regulator [Actinomycetota bacterium]